MGSPWKELSSLVPRLTPLLSRNADELSGGQQTLVGLAAAILACEQYLFLDEPSASIDHELLLTICDLLRKLSRTGLYAVITSVQIRFLKKLTADSSAEC
jgi:ABC-type multidrug transport system ATPase subunit